MNKHVKNQHTFSQFLQRFFASKDDKHIWCYDLKWKKAEERSIKNVASEVHFYDRIPGEKKGSFEYALSNAEAAAAPILKQIIINKSLNLSNDEKATMCLFLALQLIRSKTALKEIEETNEQLKSHIHAFLKEDNAKIELEFKSARQVWLSMFNATPDFAIILADKLWFLLKSDKKFYTSDNPVVKHNTVNKSTDRGTLGLKSLGIEIYFPLSDSLSIVLLCEKTFSSLKDPELNLSPENIEHMNWLQIINADRFILSSSNNFDLVVDMVDKKEM